MDKILLIIQREYLSRVKKKSFLILTFLVPILFLSMYVGVYFIYKYNNKTAKKEVVIIDEKGSFINKFINTENITYKYSNKNYNDEKQIVKNKEDVFLLYFPHTFQENDNLSIVSKSKPNFELLGNIEKQIEHILTNEKLYASGLDTAILNNTKTSVKLNTVELTETGEKSSNLPVAVIIGFIGSFLIYMSLFIYGTQVMRGIIEEKTNRIIEVIISSVKPFQLMLGKILGIGAVGLTQFLLWIIFSVLVTTLTGNLLISEIPQQSNNPLQGNENKMIETLMASLNTIDIPFILGSFLFYFLGGYLIYSALFAAVGSAVDNETETQQFMFPITIPLIFTFIIGMNVIVNQPNSPIAFWLSIIPFTSPIAMMIRIPFGVPTWQLILSMTLLIAGFIFTTWVASRIYRVGILMYGKKASYKELIKWFRYKD